MNFTATYTKPALVSRAETLKRTGMTFVLCGSLRENQETYGCIIIDASVGKIYRWIQLVIEVLGYWQQAAALWGQSVNCVHTKRRNIFDTNCKSLLGVPFVNVRFQQLKWSSIKTSSMYFPVAIDVCLITTQDMNIDILSLQTETNSLFSIFFNTSKHNTLKLCLSMRKAGLSKADFRIVILLCPSINVCFYYQSTHKTYNAPVRCEIFSFVIRTCMFVCVQGKFLLYFQNKKNPLGMIYNSMFRIMPPFYIPLGD